MKALLAVFLVALAGACTPPDQAVNEENKEIVRRFVESMNTREFDSLDELVAPDIVRHSPSTPDLMVRTLEEFKDYMRRELDSVPDAGQEIRLIVAEGDKVAVWGNYSGTQDGPMGPFPPSGKHLDLDFAGILRIEDRKIAEIWVVWDNLDMLVQLGHMSPPGSDMQ
jgi:steroid delta-isomerase-like uncharacterized protein